jgi:hypothetical protein
MGVTARLRKSRYSWAISAHWRIRRQSGLLIIGAERGFHEFGFRLDDGFEVDDADSAGDQACVQTFEQRPSTTAGGS